jgi:hypothetical protein
VRFELDEKDLDSYRRAADFLNFNNTDVLCLQHEFGIYGGPAGSHILALLKEVRMPVVTTLHTVLQHPDSAQRKVMDELVRRSDRLVVMARKGAEILERDLRGGPARWTSSPTASPTFPSRIPLSKAQFGVEGREVLLTFGLLGPGQGHRIRHRGVAGNRPAAPQRRVPGAGRHPSPPGGAGRARATAWAWSGSPRTAESRTT